jgi:CheY-like chemotaxis protein
MQPATTELDSIRQQLLSLERPKKPKMLVVDDEPDNLDLLYRTFRRDFNVLRAESGTAALEILDTEGEVAVIISDQRMPEMKGTEFLSKTVPQYPNTMRIILTGFTDVEDLVDAINSGQVYKYITKPWDPGELKTVVQRATDTYNVFKQRTEELRRAQAQTKLLEVLAQITRQPGMLEELLSPIAGAFTVTFGAEGGILQMVDSKTLTSAQGSYGIGETLKDVLAQDALVETAIATQSTQLATKDDLATQPAYGDAQVQAHLIIPIMFREEVMAILALQWIHPAALRDDELALLHLSAQQVALAIACARCLP